MGCEEKDHNAPA